MTPDGAPYVLHRVACPRLEGVERACDCDGPRLLGELVAAANECSSEGHAVARERHKVSTAVKKNPVIDEMVQTRRLQAFDRLRKSAALVGGSTHSTGAFKRFSPSTSGLHVRIETETPGGNPEGKPKP